MKESLFKLDKGRYLKITTQNGEIVSIDSPLKRYSMEKLEDALKMAVKIDFEEFLEIFKILRFDTADYKVAKKVLKETKNEMEANIKIITQLLPEY